jgi:hypothetical protein
VETNSGAFKTALGITLWLVGFLVALAFGMLSAYLVVTAVWLVPKVIARLRARGMEEVKRQVLGPGDST